ncbi:MAG: hypothetical protein FJW40_06430, partial [Acidobacteria bacterium]|nr:hypothetical protein [Acidobacteriota bacterium]
MNITRKTGPLRLPASHGLRKAWSRGGGAFSILFLAAMCSQATVITTQHGLSIVEIAGRPDQVSFETVIDGRVSVSETSGSLATPEARTAARSSAQEMAANARIDDKLRNSRTHFVDVSSEAGYTVRVLPDTAFMRRAMIDFVLPESFLEITTTAEVPFEELTTLLGAEILVCFVTTCPGDTTAFLFQASLTASHRDFRWAANATGLPGLDVTPLNNPVLTETPPRFSRNLLKYASPRQHRRDPFDPNIAKRCEKGIFGAHCPGNTAAR